MDKGFQLCSTEFCQESKEGIKDLNCVPLGSLNTVLGMYVQALAWALSTSLRLQYSIMNTFHTSH